MQQRLHLKLAPTVPSRCLVVLPIEAQGATRACPLPVQKALRGLQLQLQPVPPSTALQPELLLQLQLEAEVAVVAAVHALPNARHVPKEQLLAHDVLALCLRPIPRDEHSRDQLPSAEFLVVGRLKVPAYELTMLVPAVYALAPALAERVLAHARRVPVRGQWDLARANP